MFAVGIILLLILLNGVFAMSEASLMSSRRARLEARVARGGVGGLGAARALALVDRPTKFLSTVQIGITLIGIGAGAFGEKSIADQIQPSIESVAILKPYAAFLSSLVMVVLLTYASLILGELVPKRLALLAPETIASTVARPMNALSVAARPLVWLLTTSTDLIIRLLPFGKGTAALDEDAAEAEVRAILETGAREGVFHESEQRIVERVFRLSDQTAKGLMVPRTDIDWLRADEQVNRVRVAVATSTHSHFPICKTGLDDLVGVVHVKDLVKAGLITDDVTLGELAHPPVFVPENTPALELLEMFKENREHIVFVADEHGTLEGLVTLNDVTTAIIGEVARRDEPDDPMIVKRGEHSFLLDGMLGVNELRTLLGVEDGPGLPREDEGYETLGGMMMAVLGRIPAIGDVYEWECSPRSSGSGSGANTQADDGRAKRFARFEIVDMDRKRVDRVMLTIERRPAGDGETLGE